MRQNLIFDTSIWIDFSKGLESRQTILLEDYLRTSPHLVCITPTILQEFLMGLKNEKDFVQYLFYFQKLKIYDPDWTSISIRAAKLYFDLRKKGITIRKSTDCLIAAIAIQYDTLLVHNDSDFELIDQNSSLRTF